MTGLVAALNSFHRGELGYERLQQLVDQLLRTEPATIPDMAATLARFHNTHGLPDDIYQALLRRIERAPIAAGDSSLPSLMPTPVPSHHTGAPPNEEATRIASGPLSGGFTAGGTGPGEAAPVDVGSTLNRRFVLIESVASGGMGVVYKALDIRKQEAKDREPHVAIKVLGEDFKQHPDALMALQREAKKAQKLAHPNVVNVFDFDRDGDTVFMTMELLKGESLEHLIRRKRPGTPGKEMALAIVEGMAAGLSYAHGHNIVHSDLKPGNVFLTQDDTVKILDFGIARATKDTSHQQQDQTLFDVSALGAMTPAYASCEMLEGLDPDPRDDIYALACITYELLAGSHPFNRLAATQARDNRVQPQPVPGLSRKQQKALLAGLAFDRAKRTVSADAFYNELAGEGISPPVWAAAAGGIALATVTAVWLLIPGEPAVTVPAEPPVAKPAPLTPVEQLLESAGRHIKAGRFTEPPGNNAYNAYQKVLEIDSDNAQAHKGLQSISRYYEQLLGEVRQQRPADGKAGQP